MTFDVEIPKNNAPDFPAACVRCGDSPTTHVKIAADAVGWWSVVRFGWLYAILTGRGYDVPACARCAKSLRTERLRRKAAEWFFIIVGLALGFWVFDDWEGLKQKVAVIGLALLVAMPWFLVDQFYPATISITVYESSVTFHFANDEYAEDFAERN